MLLGQKPIDPSGVYIASEHQEQADLGGVPNWDGVTADMLRDAFRRAQPGRNGVSGQRPASTSQPPEPSEPSSLPSQISALLGLSLGALALFGLVGVALYVLPTIIAVARGHQNSLPIALVNVLLGWSVFGWVAALAWACTSVRRP